MDVIIAVDGCCWHGGHERRVVNEGQGLEVFFTIFVKMTVEECGPVLVTGFFPYEVRRVVGVDEELRITGVLVAGKSGGGDLCVDYLYPSIC